MHQKSLFILSLVLLMFCNLQSFAQDKIRVKGEVTDEMGKSITGVMVLNLRTYNGFIASGSGSFDIEIQKNDTLSVGAFGRSSQLISFADSTYKESYEIEIVLRRLEVKVGTAEVFAPRELRQIYKDIEGLGFEDKDYRTSGVDALSSPITFLYEQFSRREKSKRLVMQMENDDRRRELLKELFQKYVDYDIIELENEDFDEFVDFLRVDDDFLKNTSQYQFLLYVKDRYSTFKQLNRRLKESDYQYHLDD